jgi:hypothetical protein
MYGTTGASSERHAVQKCEGGHLGTAASEIFRGLSNTLALLLCILAYCLDQTTGCGFAHIAWTILLNSYSIHDTHDGS